MKPSKDPLLIVSGVSAGKSGTGRFLSELITESVVDPEEKVDFIFANYEAEIRASFENGRIIKGFKELFLKHYTRYSFKARLKTHVKKYRIILLIHFQNIRTENVLQIIKKSPYGVWIYLMDCGFFCLRSYNHLPGENKPCFKCLGGKWEEAAMYNCKPFPTNDPGMVDFLVKLKSYADSGNVKFLAQNDRQEKLAVRHFGVNAIVNASGLWTEDFNQLPLNIDLSIAKDYNVVVHNTILEAKGIIWTILLAAKCPDITFLFPMNADSIAPWVPSPPANCVFKNMSWETGLKEAVAKARLTLVPSLWSAPIEGSLIKSLYYSKAVAVVHAEYSYSSELPSEIIYKLSPEIESASMQMKSLFINNWMPDTEKLNEFKRGFISENTMILNRIRKLVS